MVNGKRTCRILKEIRRQIAAANGIELVIEECRYKGDCPGTCPRCESEVRYLEEQLSRRRLTGRTVALAGVSAGMLLMAGYTTTADAATPDRSCPKVIEPASTDTLPVYEAVGGVDLLPQFPGGDFAMMKFIGDNMVYPEAAAEKGIEGVVQARFEIKADGSVGDIVIEKSVDPDLDNEVKRVIKLMPTFTPGRDSNGPTDMWLTLPINFKLPPAENQ